MGVFRQSDLGVPHFFEVLLHQMKIKKNIVGVGEDRKWVPKLAIHPEEGRWKVVSRTG